MTTMQGTLETNMFPSELENTNRALYGGDLSSQNKKI